MNPAAFLTAVLLGWGGEAAPAAHRPQAAPPADTLTLADALGAALATDPRLAAARASVDAAAADVQVARADRLPDVTGSTSLIRFEEPMVIAPLHGFDPRVPPLFDRELVQGRLSVAHALYDGGERRARERAALAGTEGADALVEAAAMQALEEVVDAYLRVLTAREVLAAQQVRETDLDAERARVDHLVDEGSAARLELLRAEAALAQARAEGTAAQTNVALAEARLARATGAPPGALAGASLLEVRLLDGADPAPLPSHPLLRSAAARIAAAEATAAQIASSRLPRVSAVAGVTQYGALVEQFSAEWQAGLQVEYAVFTGGARAGRVARAEAETRRAREELRQAERQVAEAVDVAAAAETGARARAEALETAVTHFEELVRVEALALEEGAAIQADWLRARAGLFEARAGLAEARHAVIRGRVARARAEGRLTPAWVEQAIGVEP